MALVEVTEEVHHGRKLVLHKKESDGEGSLRIKSRFAACCVPDEESRNCWKLRRLMFSISSSKFLLNYFLSNVHLRYRVTCYRFKADLNRIQYLSLLFAQHSMRHKSIAENSR